MARIRTTGDIVFRDMESPGSVVPNEPDKGAIRSLLGLIDNTIMTVAAGGSGAFIVKATVADLDADLDHDAGVFALVFADDQSPAENGYYEKTGASGAGSWDFVSEDPAVVAAAQALASEQAAGVSAGEAETASDAAVAAAATVIAALPVVYIGDLSQVLYDFQAWFSATPTPYGLTQSSEGLLALSYAETDEASADGTHIDLYINPVTGSDSNNGLTLGTAKKTFAATLALNSSDSKVVHLDGDIFYRDTSPAAYTYSHHEHLTIKPVSGKPLVTTALAPSEVAWVANGAAYQTAATGVGNVFDASIRDFRGVPRRYSNVANLAAVQAQAGSWAEVAGVVYVRTFDDRAPDDEVLVNMKTGGFTVTPRSGKTTRFEDTIYLMGSAASDCVRVSTQAATTGYFQHINCVFGGGGADALGCRNCTLVWGRGSSGAYAKVDVFSYTRVGHSLPMDFVEYGCHEYEAGTFGGSGSSNNCSTAHEGIRGLRLNGVAANALGPVVADVNGCMSLIVNFSANGSTLGSGDVAASFYTNNTPGIVNPTPDGKMFVIGGSSSGSLYDFGSDATNPCPIYWRAWRGVNATPTASPGAVVTEF